MREFLFAGVFAALVGGCGGETVSGGPAPQSRSYLQTSSGSGFRRLLSKKTGQPEEGPSESAKKIGRALALAQVDPNVKTGRPESPTPESDFITARVEEVATNYAWVTATFPETVVSRPSIGDWAAVVERAEPDNTNPILEEKRDMVMALGRVLELQGQTVKIQLDQSSVRPRIEKGNDVIIRWY